MAEKEENQGTIVKSLKECSRCKEKKSPQKVIVSSNHGVNDSIVGTYEVEAKVLISKVQVQPKEEAIIRRKYLTTIKKKDGHSAKGGKVFIDLDSLEAKPEIEKIPNNYISSMV